MPVADPDNHEDVDQKRVPVSSLKTWLEELMHTKGLTPGTLASKTGIDPKSIAKMLRGEPVRDSVRRKLTFLHGVHFDHIPRA